MIIKQKSYCIIIVNFNSTEYVIQCLQAVGKFISLNQNVLVIDNCSSDRPERIAEKFPKIKLVIQKKNIGFSAAVNKAIKISRKTEYLILINPDCEPKNNFIERCISFMDQNPDVGILGPKILDPDGCIQGSARSFPTPLTAIFGRKSPLTKLFPNNRVSCRNILTNNSDGRSPMQVDWVSGACMIIRRKCLETVGGFDERFFLYWEDTDICKRFKDAGWKVVYYPPAEVVHHTGISSNTRPILSICHFHKSCYLLFKKYAKWPKNLLEPVAILGLGFRCVVVVLLNLVNKMVQHRNLEKHLIKQSGYSFTRPIKILRVISRLNIGGPAIHVAILSKGLNHSIFTNKLVVGQISDHEGDMAHIIDKNRQTIVRIPCLQREISPIKDIRAFFSILSLIIKEKPDIVHTHLSKAGAIVRPAVWLSNLMTRQKIRTVHTFHGHVFDGYFGKWKTGFYIWIERILAQFTDVIIVLSSKQQKDLVEKYRIVSKRKTKIIPLGLNLSIFENIKNNHRGKFRKHFNCSDNDILIAIVGRLVPIKNHIMFFDAAKILLEQKPEANIKFMIIGDGELRYDLEKYCKKLGLESKTIFCGWVNDMASVYRDINILALTSLNEGTPVSVIEAMASGVPVIATNVGGVQDLLGEKVKEHDGFTQCQRGIVCPSNDPIKFGSAMRFVLENKDNISATICNASEQFVLRNYSKTRLLEDMAILYNNLIYSSRK